MRVDQRKGRAAAFQAEDRGVRLSQPAPNNMTKDKRYCLRFKTGKWIALDNNSGGYPYGVDNLIDAHNFYSTKACETYMVMFKDSIEQKVYRVRITAEYAV